LSNLFGRGDRANWSRIYNDERWPLTPVISL
jgi:hypothetical protein